MHNFINTQTAPAAAAPSTPATPPPAPPPPPLATRSDQLSFCCTRQFVTLFWFPAILIPIFNPDPDPDPNLMLTRRLSLLCGVDWIMASEVSACLARSLCHNLFVNGLASWPRHANPSSHPALHPRPACLAASLPACLHCDWSFAVASRRPHTPLGQCGWWHVGVRAAVGRVQRGGVAVQVRVPAIRMRQPCFCCGIQAICLRALRVQPNQVEIPFDFPLFMHRK